MQMEIEGCAPSQITIVRQDRRLDEFGQHILKNGFILP